ncbi:MAG: hypothetical protein ABJB16_07140, partial [Saprospiraceae bacterium]
MKNILTLSISISIFYMSLNCKILNSSQANSDISLRIINDLVKSWYSPLIKSDVCYEDTLNIFINDTLTWRRPKLLSSDTIQQILSFFNIIPERYEAQIISDKRTSYPDFLKKRGVISNYASTMGCKMYYFSQAYKT